MLEVQSREEGSLLTCLQSVDSTHHPDAQTPKGSPWGDPTGYAGVSARLAWYGASPAPKVAAVYALVSPSALPPPRSPITPSPFPLPLPFPPFHCSAPSVTRAL